MGMVQSGFAKNKTGDGGRPIAGIKSNSTSMTSSIRKFVNMPGSLGVDYVNWSGIPSLVFLYHLYLGATIYLQRKNARYLKYVTWRPKTSRKQTKLLLEKYDTLLK